MSKNSLAADPYLYPGSSVLINKFGLKNQDALQETEGFIFALKNLEPLPTGNFDYNHLKAIHHHFFGDIYEWAGQERTVDIAKGDCYFGHKQYITKELNKLFLKLKTDNYLRDLPHDAFCKKISFYFNEINAAHPFREGNGRTQRAFCDALAKQAGYFLDWRKADREEYIHASIAGFLHGDYTAMWSVLKNITTPLDQTHKIDGITLEKNMLALLKNYVNKQLELTENVLKKNQSLIENIEHSKTTSEKILSLNNEIKKMEKELCNDSNAILILKQSKPIPLQKQGGFSSIHQRFQKNEMAAEDIHSVLHYAKNNAFTAIQLLGQKRTK
ncbi:hypothetical protein AYO45_01995 [Gammaproteobacteria bacterium SCGC AG-212-F23]|nr:hypothetical protein AYO45_01995 [Gammaproteobacteria bacterium SCGC AG-212-F23]